MQSCGSGGYFQDGFFSDSREGNANDTGSSGSESSAAATDSGDDSGSSQAQGNDCDDPPCFNIWEAIKNVFRNPLRSSGEQLENKQRDTEVTEKLIDEGIEAFGTALELQVEVMTAPLGGPGKGFVAKNILQRGGQTLMPGTLKTLNLTKEQGRNAIHALKADKGLPNDFHGIIMKNGDYINPTTKAVIENIFNFVY